MPYILILSSILILFHLRYTQETRQSKHNINLEKSENCLLVFKKIPTTIRAGSLSVCLCVCTVAIRKVTDCQVPVLWL